MCVYVRVCAVGCVGAVDAIKCRQVNFSMEFMWTMMMMMQFEITHAKYILFTSQYYTLTHTLTISFGVVLAMTPYCAEKSVGFRWCAYAAIGSHIASA